MSRRQTELHKQLLNATLAGVSPVIDLASVLGMLESSGATGIFRAREGTSLNEGFYLRFNEGRIVKAIGNPERNVVSLLARMLSSKDLVWTFKAVPCPPSGDLNMSITGVMLEAAGLLDHMTRDVDDVLSSLEEGAPAAAYPLRLVS